jgi:hypothetical protein
MGLRGPKPGTPSPNRGKTNLSVRPFSDALNLAIRRIIESGPDKGRRRLDVIAERLALAALNGDPWAITEVANRLDGRPAQQVYSLDQSGNQMPASLAIMFVSPDGKTAVPSQTYFPPTIEHEHVPHRDEERGP